MEIGDRVIKSKGEDDKLLIKWTESFTEEIVIKPVENKRGIIKYESH